MDSTIDEFVRQVLNFRHTTFTADATRRLASHLRDVVQPQLEEREQLQARVNELEAENAALKKKKGA